MEVLSAISCQNRQALDVRGPNMVAMALSGRAGCNTWRSRAASHAVGLSNFLGESS